MNLPGGLITGGAHGNRAGIQSLFLRNRNRNGTSELEETLERVCGGSVGVGLGGARFRRPCCTGRSRGTGPVPRESQDGWGRIPVGQVVGEGDRDIDGSHVRPSDRETSYTRIPRKSRGIRQGRGVTPRGERGRRRGIRRGV